MGWEDGPSEYLLGAWFAPGKKAEWDANAAAYALPWDYQIPRIDRERKKKPNGENAEKVLTWNQQTLVVASELLRICRDIERGIAVPAARLRLARLRARVVLAHYGISGVSCHEDFGYGAFHGGGLAGIYLGATVLGWRQEAAEARRMLRYHVAWHSLHSFVLAEDGSLRSISPGRRMGSMTTTGFAPDLALYLGGFDSGAGRDWPLQGANSLLHWALLTLVDRGLDPFTPDERAAMRAAATGDRLPVAEMLIGYADSDAEVLMRWDDVGGFDSGLTRLEANSENPIAACTAGLGRFATLRPSDIAVADGWVTREAKPWAEPDGWSVLWTGYSAREARNGRAGAPRVEFKDRLDTLKTLRRGLAGAFSCGVLGIEINGGNYDGVPCPWPPVPADQQPPIEGGDVEPKPQDPTKPQRQTPLSLHSAIGVALTAKPPRREEALKLTDQLAAMLRARG